MYPYGVIASITSTETENTIPMVTEAMTAIHQNCMFLHTCFTPSQNGERSNVALAEGGFLGLLGKKKVGIAQTVDKLATMIN